MTSAIDDKKQFERKLKLSSEGFQFGPEVSSGACRRQAERR